MIKNQSIHSIIQLMDNGEVIHTLDIENINDYKFYFDNKKLSTLSITISNLGMKDSNILFTKPYEHYIVMGTKTKDNYSYAIPAKVYNKIKVKDKGSKIKIIFSEEVQNNGKN